MAKVTTKKVLDPQTRQKAIQVIQEVYLKEKKWINTAESEISPDIAQSEKISWFLAEVDGQPAGVIRLVYNPDLNFPPDFEVSLNQDVDIDYIKENYKIVDIGRFMILPKYRKKILVALRLMKAAITEVVQRDYTHFITDVFENEPNSPLHFHTNILGFEIIGKHVHGELNCSCTRIILALDILKSYKRFKEKRGKVYRFLTQGISDLLEKRLTTKV